jgi:hypothetical protein
MTARSAAEMRTVFWTTVGIVVIGLSFAIVIGALHR